MTPADVERELGPSRYTQHDERRAGRLPYLRVGLRGIGYEREAVMRWWSERYAPRPAAPVRVRRRAA